MIENKNNKITKQSDLWREYARVIDMCERTNVKPINCWKFDGNIGNLIPRLKENIDRYEFALAIVEDRPVFAGDSLWTKEGVKITITEGLPGVDKYHINHEYGTVKIDYLTWEYKKPVIIINGKEYARPILKYKDGFNYYFILGEQSYYFDELGDMECVYSAIIDILHGK